MSRHHGFERTADGWFTRILRGFVVCSGCVQKVVGLALRMLMSAARVASVGERKSMDFSSSRSMDLLSGASTWRSGLAAGRPGCLVARAHELEVGLELWPVALRTRCFSMKT
jgi:hypothetical protein